MRNASLKSGIRNNIVSVDALFRGATEKVALVKKSNESNGTCTIEYDDFDGNRTIAKDVKVRLSNPSIVDWFPKKGDYVFIKEDLDIVTVLGDATHIVTNSSGVNSLFENDIFSNSTNNNVGGFIV